MAPALVNGGSSALLILVRHGQTAPNRAGLILGSRLDPPLDEVGREQVARLAGSEALGDLAGVVSSPLLRAQQTAATLDLPVVTDPRWLELDFGELDGTPLDPQRQWTREPLWAPPGGESLEKLAVRVVEACEELAPRCVEENIAVVTHAFPIKAALAWALGTDVWTALRIWITLGSVSRVLIGPDWPVVISINEHLGPLDRHLRRAGDPGPTGDLVAGGAGSPTNP